MQGFLESASAILAQSERRVETAAQNVSNVATPGYKRKVDFAELVQGSTTLSSFADLKAGKCYISILGRKNPLLQARADIVWPPQK